MFKKLHRCIEFAALMALMLVLALGGTFMIAWQEIRQRRLH